MLKKRLWNNKNARYDLNIAVIENPIRYVFGFARGTNSEWIVLCCGRQCILVKWCHVACCVRLREAVGSISHFNSYSLTVGEGLHLSHLQDVKGGRWAEILQLPVKLHPRVTLGRYTHNLCCDTDSLFCGNITAISALLESNPYFLTAWCSVWFIAVKTTPVIMRELKREL